MILRPISLAEADTLVALARRAFIDAFGHLYAPEDLQSFLDSERTPEKFARLIEDAGALVTVAEEDGVLLGYCTVMFGESFAGRPDPQPLRPCILGQLYCAGEATGRGVGAALLDHAIGAARARGCDAMQLSVYSENFGAQRFYARRGFAHVADIDFWVGNKRDDEFLYELAL
ncbi:N-acetyltransferase [Tsuneonella deserti]|uniref:N-acetyltransferase n=1 Tax=Tsuneonella deserti TaxID=2035528 RepID=A0ABQ1S994_9SPHN|nr:GNAT family N-acetyltransferase [Tsuneonella deserti]GGD99888.1 N-acetyltransferase [Tsuneonella deserti]